MQGPAIFWHWWQNSVRKLVNDLDVMGKKNSTQGVGQQAKSKNCMRLSAVGNRLHIQRCWR